MVKRFTPSLMLSSSEYSNQASAVFRLHQITSALIGLSLGSAALATNQNQTGDVPLTVLPAVNVSQTAAPSSPYAGGQVAAGSHVGILGDKTVMETPFSNISYTEEFIENLQAKSVTDVIAKTDPAVFSNGVSSAWSENYSIRGFSSSTSDISVDGLSGIAPNYRISPEMYERIEVLKGPSAMLNGMPPGGSVGGTINLVPKRATETPLMRLTTSYMSDSQLGVHLDAGRRFGDQQQWGVRINGLYRNGDTAINEQEQKTQLASLGLDWRNDVIRASIDAYHSTDHIVGVTRGISLAPGVAVPTPPKPGTLLNPSWGYADNKDRGAILRGELDINDGLSAYAAFGLGKSNYQSNGAMSAQILNNTGTFITRIGQLEFEIDKKSAEAGLRNTFQTGSINHQLNLNATYYRQKQDDYGRRNVAGAEWTSNIYNPKWGQAAPFYAPPIFKTALQLTSLGLSDTLTLLQDQVQITAGLRRQNVINDSFNVSTGARTSRYDQSATTPMLALLLKPSEHFSIYTNYIEGLSQGGSAPMDAANAGEIFAPYKSKQIEAGFKFEHDNFTHTFSLFEIRRPNSYLDPTSKIFSFAGEQRNRGIEWSFFGELIPGVRPIGGIAYLDPKVTKASIASHQDKQAIGIPKVQAKLGLEWDVSAAHGLTIYANAISVSKQYINADNSLSVDGRTTFDLGARYRTQIASQALTLRASIENLSNESYWGTPIFSSLAQGDPRTVNLSMTVDF